MQNTKREVVLITGASGQLGSELKETWKSDANFELVFWSSAELALDRPSEILDRIIAINPDYIIHAAAYTAVDLAETQQELVNTVNHLASEEIAKAANLCQAKLIFISTDYVFQGNENRALSPDDPTDPINAYGLSKLMAEQGIQKILPPSIIIRTSWVYSTYGKNFVKTMLHLMTNRPEINVVNDQFGSPTYARDLAIIIQEVIKSGVWEPGVYHYANEGEISWYDFAKEIRDQAGLTCQINPVSSDSFPVVAARPKYSLLSKEKIKAVYHIQVPDWKDSLATMLSLWSSRSY